MLRNQCSIPSLPPRISQNCKDSAFCTRLRGNTSSAFAIDGASVTIKGPAVHARVLNKEDANGTFALTLTAYGGIVRLHITELSATPARYEVPDVLLPSVPSMAQDWEVVKKTPMKLKLKLGTADVELRFAPVQLAIAVGGKPVLTWNDAGSFIFEHRREKQEGDPEGWWAESFKTHHDSKPRGPEAISFDVTMHQYSHVYGLPERATSHSLNPTRGESNSNTHLHRLTAHFSTLT